MLTPSTVTWTQARVTVNLREAARAWRDGNTGLALAYVQAADAWADVLRADGAPVFGDGA